MLEEIPPIRKFMLLVLIVAIVIRLIYVMCFGAPEDPYYPYAITR